MDRDTELGMLSVIITMIVLYLSIWLFIYTLINFAIQPGKTGKTFY